MLWMEINCGTKNPYKEQIDLDQFSDCKKVEANADQATQAYDILRELMTNRRFAGDGYRNTSAVNGCIALHVLGFDAESWFENWCAAQPSGRFFKYDLDEFMQHVERVSPYLSSWGPKGNEAQALNYLI